MAVIERVASLDSGTRLSVTRTRLSYERTLMSWVRTAASLISFGFSIYKFFELDLNRRAADAVIGSREFAALLIALGVSGLVMALTQNRHDTWALAVEYGVSLPSSTATKVAIGLAVVGVVAFIAVLIRV
jgi:putative membrane protein